MSQTERKPDLPELPRGLNRMLMTSPQLLPYRPSLVRFLTLGVGTALTAAGLIIGGGLGVLPALGLIAASVVGTNAVTKLCDHALKRFFYAGDTNPVAAPPHPSLAFAMRLGHQLIKSRANQTGLIELYLNPNIYCYRAILFRDGRAVIEMNPNYTAKLHDKLAKCEEFPAGTTCFAEMHAFALQHEIQHRQQPLWHDTYGQSLFLTSTVGLVGTALTFLPATPSLTQVFTSVLAPIGIYTLNLIRIRQNELDADSAAVRHLGSAATGRLLLETPDMRQWSLSYPSPALRIAAAELQESRLTEAERRGARAAFKALYENTIAEFPELTAPRSGKAVTPICAITNP